MHQQCYETKERGKCATKVYSRQDCSQSDVLSRHPASHCCPETAGVLVSYSLWNVQER